MVPLTITDFEIAIFENLTYLRPSSPKTMKSDEKNFLSIVMWNTILRGFWHYLHIHASMLTQSVTGPVGPVTPSIYWSCKISTGPTNISLTQQEKTMHEIHNQCSFFIHFIFIYFKNMLGHSCGKNLTRMLPNVYWTCRTSWGPFLVARSPLKEFLLAWGKRFTVSFKPWQIWQFTDAEFNGSMIKFLKRLKVSHKYNILVIC